MDVKVTDDMMAEFKEAVYLIGLMQGLVLKDKGVKYSLVGESKIKDKPVLGVTVSREGKKDINLFVDKDDRSRRQVRDAARKILPPDRKSPRNGLLRNTRRSTARRWQRKSRFSATASRTSNWK